MGIVTFGGFAQRLGELLEHGGFATASPVQCHLFSAGLMGRLIA
jgi:hypothetical protein